MARPAADGEARPGPRRQAAASGVPGRPASRCLRQHAASRECHRRSPRSLRRPVALTRALVDIAVGLRRRRALADAVEAALRALGGLEVERVGNTVLARTNLGRPSGSCSPGTSTPCRSPTTCPSDCARRRDRLYGCGTSRHEVRRRGDAAARRRFGVPGAEPRTTSRSSSTTTRRSSAERNGLGRVAREQRGLAVRRPRGPAGAHRRRDRGRLPGHAAGRLRDDGPAGAQRPQLAGRQRDPRAPAPVLAPAGRVPAARGRDRRLRLPRGAQRGRHRRRRRRQRDPGRVRR